MNWWQMGHDVDTSSTSAMVEACISAYSQTVAMCPGDHWHLKEDGGRERVTTSALSRILRKPNDYQTISDFLLNAVRNLYADGNAYALALRNSRFEVSELHLMNSRISGAYVAVTGDIFYQLAGNAVLEQRVDYPLLVPARDVLHIRLHTQEWDPLRGESPIIAAARDIAASNAMAAQQLSFFLNHARPGIVLSTDMTLDKDQVTALRDRWNEQSRGLGSGGTPILTSGLKPVPIPQTAAVDAQLADIMKMSKENIALAFRIPLQVLGIGGGAQGSTEALMQGWLASSLGFCLNHVEEAFGKLFGLSGYPDDYVEFNTAALLRSAQKDRIESLARAVQGGIFSPNEARRTEGYPDVEFGDEPRVQSQVVPLSAAQGIPAAPASPASPATPTTTSAVEEDEAAPKGISDERERSFRRRLQSSHERNRAVV